MHPMMPDGNIPLQPPTTYVDAENKHEFNTSADVKASDTMNAAGALTQNKSGSPGGKTSGPSSLPPPAGAGGAGSAAVLNGPAGTANPWFASYSMAAVRNALQAFAKQSSQDRFVSDQASIEVSQWLKEQGIDQANFTRTSGEMQALMTSNDATAHFNNGCMMAANAAATGIIAIASVAAATKSTKKVDDDFTNEKTGILTQAKSASAKAQTDVDTTKTDLDADPTSVSKQQAHADAKATLGRRQDAVFKAENDYSERSMAAKSNTSRHLESLGSFVNQAFGSGKEFNDYVKDLQNAALQNAKATVDQSQKLAETWQRMAQTAMDNLQANSKRSDDNVSQAMQAVNQIMQGFYTSFKFGPH